MKDEKPIHFIRTQKNADGTTFIWKWPTTLGPDYCGPQVIFSVVQTPDQELIRVQNK